MENRSMPHVVTDACEKDLLCVDACPTECIHPTKGEAAFDGATQVYINPDECMDCGGCVAVCPKNAIFEESELPADKAGFAAKNAEFFK
jgi:NAD-dependent dihydropyrimidine dehydrogenase PreA subunit